MGLNLPSKKIGFKDLLKIENKILSTSEINAISPFCVGATLSIIEDFKVVKKGIIKLPDIIDNIIICPNPRCVSHLHRSKFRTVGTRNLDFNIICHYCEQKFLLQDIKNFSYNIDLKV